MIEFSESQRRTIATGVTVLCVALVVAFVAFVAWLALKGLALAAPAVVPVVTGFFLALLFKPYFTWLKSLVRNPSLALTLMLAYAMTKTDMPGHGALMVFLIIMMYFDGGMIPHLLLYRDMGLFDTFAVYVLPAGISVYNALLLRNFLNTIPSSLTESARLDGASEMTILTRILLPLAKPGIATISLFVAVGKWNDWFSGVAYITPGNTVPLQTYLKNMMGLSQLKLNAMAELQNMVTPPPETLKMAAIVLTVLPIVIVYPFVQKYFVQGLLIGSVKE